jgi:hypothetical protein
MLTSEANMNTCTNVGLHVRRCDVHIGSGNMHFQQRVNATGSIESTPYLRNTNRKAKVRVSRAKKIDKPFLEPRTNGYEIYVYVFTSFLAFLLPLEAAAFLPSLLNIWDAIFHNAG